ncbi:hypothetical protein [Tateyamaria omphalii]|uniref:hypothetical protein n=1 Tax=Tateyamaria omphalii TaxID=299262 RepID=UPI001C12AB6D|nr:hypothetical protein [Tateyamaria omphalii]
MRIDGIQVAEDSVPITTERSFNAESFTFQAERPFVIGLVAKDFKQNDTGLEYIGTRRQQMGDGGVIVQIKTANGAQVAVSDAGWDMAGFDTSDWPAANVYSARQVDPKDGYDQITWAQEAKLIWGPDPEQSNTVLCRITVE